MTTKPRNTETNASPGKAELSDEENEIARWMLMQLSDAGFHKDWIGRQLGYSGSNPGSQIHNILGYRSGISRKRFNMLQDFCKQYEEGRLQPMDEPDVEQEAAQPPDAEVCSEDFYDFDLVKGDASVRTLYHSILQGLEQMEMALTKKGDDLPPSPVKDGLYAASKKVHGLRKYFEPVS